MEVSGAGGTSPGRRSQPRSRLYPESNGEAAKGFEKGEPCSDLCSGKLAGL